MLKRKEDLSHVVLTNFKGGEGDIIMDHLINSPDELYGKGRVYSKSTLNKNCGVGWHQHVGDGEFFYALKGEAEYNDNGTICTLRAGDLAFTGDGEWHSIVNRKDEPFEMMALVIYK